MEVHTSGPVRSLGLVRVRPEPYSYHNVRRGLASGTLDTGCCLRITTWCAKLIRRRPGASGLCVRATRINHLRAVRTGGAGQRALAPLAAYRVYCLWVRVVRGT